MVVHGAASQIALTGVTTSLTSGATRTFTATIQDAAGNAVNDGADATDAISFTQTAGAGSVSFAAPSSTVGGVATDVATGVLAGSVTIRSSAALSGPGATNSNALTFTVVHGAASQIALTGVTTSLTSGTTRTFTATIQDAAGNTVNDGPDATDAISFSQTGTPPGSVSFAAPSSTVGGVATDVATGVLAGSLTIRSSATPSGPGATNSNALTFTVVHGAASQIALTGVTTSLTSGTTRTFAATIQDAAGNTVTDGPDATDAISFGKTAGAGTVSFATPSSTTAGVATDVVTGVLAGPVSIRATATLSGPGTTNSNTLTFTVVHGTASQIVLSASTADLASATTRTFTATIEDAAGNTVNDGTDSTAAVSFSQTAGAGSVSFATPSSTTGGVATDVVTGVLAGSVTIRATATLSGPGSTNSNTLTFNVVAGTATKLVFTQQPTNTAAAATITPAVTVSVEDANGNVLTTDNSTKVTLAIGTNPAGGTLTGGGQVTVVSGVATYSGLSINNAGNGYTLTATDTTGAGGGHPYTSATSSTFNIISTALTYTATGTAQTWSTGATAKNVSYPAGTNTNDLLLLVYVTKSNKQPTVPAGWTQLTTANQGSFILTTVYWKLAAPADGGQVSVTPGDGNAASAWVVQYLRPSGYPPNPAVATATSTSGSNNGGTTATTTGVTTNQASATVISVVGQAQSTTALSLSTANGYTLRTQTSANGLSFGVADVLVATSGTATSAPVWSSAPTSAQWAWSTDAFH
jgi:hypothetical protein